MIILLIGLLVLVSVVLVFMKRNMESFLIFGLCASLFVLWFVILTYIAKKGGISPNLSLFLYLNNSIKVKLQYLMITLGRLGYMLAIGRYLFPFFLIQLAIHYNLSPAIRKRRWLRYVAAILPALSLVLYYPKIFETITSSNPLFQRILVQGTKIWIILYVIISILLLICEYIDTTIKFSKRRFLHKCVLIFSLIILYLLYYQQDPAQIYLFYRNDYMWLLGLWYLSPHLSLNNYIVALGIAMISGIVGFTNLLRFTHRKIREDQTDLVLQRKFDAASAGVPVFVHSIKNQLLTNRILHKRLETISFAQPTNIEAMAKEIRLLKSNNEMMISHMESLYNTVKSRNIYLVPLTIGEIIDEAIDAFLKKNPAGNVEIEADREIQVLADLKHISSALYNLLTNAWEATLEAGSTRAVVVKSHQERMYTVFEVQDYGVGLERKQINKLFEPFYSSKNTNYNWGMGLYYTRSIIKSHLGNLWVESKVGEGTRIFASLPRYDSKL